MFKTIDNRLFNRFKKGKNHFLYGAILMCLASSVYGEDTTDSKLKNTILVEKTDLQDKMFRKAVFFYYQQKPSLALQQLSYNKTKFGELPPNSRLFEAGLQISLGMPQQAQKNLLELVNSLPETKNKGIHLNADSDKGQNNKYLDHNDLYSVALLALSDQQISNGNIHLAQQTLAKLTHIPDRYYDQYKQLSQLAYWPNEVSLIEKTTFTDLEDDAFEGADSKGADSKGADSEGNGSDDDNQAIQIITENNAYLLINNAIRFIELEDYEQAYDILTQVKQYKMQIEPLGFWQSLFSETTETNTDDESQTARLSEQALEERAIRDYAGLLIAQMHVSLGMYQAAYDDLSLFPQNSPYTEQALFLFAYSAYKKESYAQSTNGFNQLISKFPHSDMSWQGAAINAKQFEQQGLLDNALVEYIKIEKMYREYLNDIDTFSRAITSEPDILSYAKDKDNSWSLNREFRIHNEISFSTASPWLAKAVKDIELSTWFQQLIELKLLTKQLESQQQQTEELADLILLNEQRQRQIMQKTKNDKYQRLFDRLSVATKSIADKFTDANAVQNGQAFANPDQQEWLSRIDSSKQRIAKIFLTKNTADYQERLARIEGVLAWSLKKQQPVLQQKSAVKLGRLESQLRQTQQQLLRVNQLLSKDLPLTKASIRQQVVVDRIQQSLFKIDGILAATTQKVQIKINSFVKFQESLLTRHLLVTQRSMARVIEQIERQEMLERKRQLNLGNTPVVGGLK